MRTDAVSLKWTNIVESLPFAFFLCVDKIQHKHNPTHAINTLFLEFRYTGSWFSHQQQLILDTVECLGLDAVPLKWTSSVNVLLFGDLSGRGQSFLFDQTRAIKG